MELSDVFRVKRSVVLFDPFPNPFAAGCSGRGRNTSRAAFKAGLCIINLSNVIKSIVIKIRQKTAIIDRKLHGDQSPVSVERILQTSPSAPGQLAGQDAHLCTGAIVIFEILTIIKIGVCRISRVQCGIT